MTAAVLALLASVGFGAGDFLGGLKSRRLSLASVLVIAQLGSLALGAVVLLLVRPAAPSGHLLAYAGVAGVVQAVGLAAYYKGLASGAMGVVAPISAMAAIIPVTVGLTLGEQLGLHQAAGIVVATVGIVVTSIERTGADVGRPRMAVGVGLALVAAICIGAGLACVGRASDGGSVVWVLIVSRSVLTGIVLVVLAAKRQAPVVEHREVAGVMSVGLLSATGTLLFALATTQGQISIAAVITSVYPITTIGLAWLVLRERVAPTQRVGAVVALVGVALVAA